MPSFLSRGFESRSFLKIAFQELVATMLRFYAGSRAYSVCRGHLSLLFVFFRYDQLKVLSDVVAKEVNVLKVDVPGGEGRGWKRSHAEVSTDELPSRWRQKISDGAQYIIRETWVKANDPHIDAKAALRSLCFDELGIPGKTALVARYQAP